MNPTKQRIAIAEYCGWKYRPEHDVEFNTPAGRVAPESWRIDYPNGDCEATCFDGLPDYLNDLNAMHEAEKKLEKRYEYTEKLGRILGITYGPDGEMEKTDFEFDLAHATASQRAEAFLKTIGKWEE